LVVERTIFTQDRILSSGSDIATLYSVDRAEIKSIIQQRLVKTPDTQTLLKSNWPVTIGQLDDKITGKGQSSVLGFM